VEKGEVSCPKSTFILTKIEAVTIDKTITLHQNSSYENYFVIGRTKSNELK
jgi:hypothetical protein